MIDDYVRFSFVCLVFWSNSSLDGVSRPIFAWSWYWIACLEAQAQILFIKVSSERTLLVVIAKLERDVMHVIFVPIFVWFVSANWSSYPLYLLRWFHGEILLVLLLFVSIGPMLILTRRLCLDLLLLFGKDRFLIDFLVFLIRKRNVST